MTNNKNFFFQNSTIGQVFDVEGLRVYVEAEDADLREEYR